MADQNHNGQRILQTLENTNAPMTLTQIVQQIADMDDVPRQSIKDDVKATVDNGVRFGYLKCSRRRYFAPTVDDEATSVEFAYKKDDGVQDGRITPRQRSAKRNAVKRRNCKKLARKTSRPRKPRSRRPKCDN